MIVKCSSLVWTLEMSVAPVSVVAVLKMGRQPVLTWPQRRTVALGTFTEKQSKDIPYEEQLRAP